MKHCPVTAAFLIAASLAAVGHAAEPAMQPPAAATLPADAIELLATVTRLDCEMFDAYNAHDLAKLMGMFADDLEFYHDTGGLAGHEQARKGFAGVFANSPDIRRDLVGGSLEVYPVKDYGAIEIGAHRFCHTENGKPDCGTFRFVQVWRLQAGAWKVSRVVSYGH